MPAMILSRTQSTSPPYWQRYYKSVWFFPAILAIILLMLTAFKISGTSAGIYYPALYGQNARDPNLITGKPRGIRSDEWIFVTQMTIAQHAAGFPEVNNNINHGRDMSIVGDAPYKDWSMLFKPQNLAFFFLPFENAFAFKWWMLLYFVILSCYLFVLKLFPGRRLFAALFATSIGFSPFLFWWYQTATLGSIAYGFFILLLGIRIVEDTPLSLLKNQRPIYSRTIYTLGLAYLLICFALILYPPFQIPIALLVVVFLAGYLLNKYGFSKRFLQKSALWTLGIFLSAVLIAGATTITFIETRPSVIHAIENTVYPGMRVIPAGGMAVNEIFSTYLQPQLQRESRAIHYYTNQSEASSFFLFLPFLIIPGFGLLIFQFRHDRSIDWPLLLTQSIIILFLLNMFMSGMQILYKLSLLDKVPHARLLMGLGFAGVLQLLLVVKSIERNELSGKLFSRLVIGYVLICLVPLLWDGQFVRTHYPHFIHSWVLIGLFGLLYTAILFCFLYRRTLVAAALLLVFSTGSVFHVHPLYHGLGPLYNNTVIAAIDNVSKPHDTWGVVDNLLYENFPALANRDSISGIQLYPDLSFWRQIQGNKQEYIYNRYAHVIFNSDPAFTAQIKLIQDDSFQVRFACTPFIEKHVQYALATHQLVENCVHQVKEIHYPATTFYLYKIS